MTVYLVQTKSKILDIFDNEAEAQKHASCIGDAFVTPMETKNKSYAEDLKILSIESNVYWFNRYNTYARKYNLTATGHQDAKKKRAFVKLDGVYTHDEKKKGLCLSFDLVVSSEKIPADWEKKCFELHRHYEKIANNMYQVKYTQKSIKDAKKLIEAELEKVLLDW